MIAVKNDDIHKNQSICITAGGSGGHVIPAQALARELQLKGYSVFFAADSLSKNRFFSQREFPAFDIPSSPISLRSPKKLILFLFHLMLGTWKAFWLLRKYKPSACIGFGSYHTVSTLFAACLCNVPIILHEANAHPGRVVRLFARFSKWVGCYFSEAGGYLKTFAREIKIVDLPLRAEMNQMGLITRKKAHEYYSTLDPSLYTIVVVGGSQGAQKINELMPRAIYESATVSFSRESKNRPYVQVIHLAGTCEETDRLRKEYEHLGDNVRAVVKPFEPSMQYALRASDLIISRSGASTLAEIEKAQIPAILIPYPYAMDDHQTLNALAFIQKGMQATLLSEKELSFDSAVKAIVEKVDRWKRMGDGITKGSCVHAEQSENESSFLRAIEATITALDSGKKKS